MASILHQIAQNIGMDKAIAYTSGARIVQGISGFNITFGSKLALQVFLELGLTGIMQQYVAHEASHLNLDENKQYQGEEQYQSRLASLVKFCLKWYSVLAGVVLVFLIIVGNIYFSKYGNSQSSSVEWKLPWIII